MNARHRVHGQGFVILPNSSAADERLSFRARGLLAYMLSRPPGWRFDSARIAAEGKEGRDAVRTALAELREHGYYRTTKVRTAGGRFVTVTEVASTPAAMPADAPSDVDSDELDGDAP